MHVFNMFTVFRMFLECLLFAESWVVSTNLLVAM
jgi:hypothetical protein